MADDVQPVHFPTWLDQHRADLQPPVGNAQIWPGNRDFMVTVVGGPNARTDYHVNQGEEFFHQLEGEMTLRTLQDGRRVDIRLGPGQMLLLPPNVPHSPQRPAGTVGFVLERKRLPDELDTFLWICDRCDSELYRESLHVTDIVAQLPPVFARYWDDPAHTTCRQCGQTHARPPRG